MKYRVFYSLLLVLFVSLACSVSKPTPNVDATVAAAVAATSAANPTDTPAPPTPTPKPTNTSTPDADATIAAAVAATIAANPTDTPEPTNTPIPEPTATPIPESTDTPVPEPTEAPALQLEAVTLATYTDPGGYFKVDLPDDWETESDDGLVFRLSLTEDAAILVMAVPNAELGMTNQDLELYGEGFLESFFEDLGASVEIEDSAAEDNISGLKFNASDGQTTQRGGIILSLEEEILFHLMIFADERLPQEAIGDLFDQILDTFTVTYQASAAATPTDTPASSPVARTYKLAFARWDGGKHDLYIANTNGGGEKFLLERAAGPSWSDDGQYLSFYGTEGVDRQIRGGVEYVVPGITNGILWLKAANFPDDITQVEIDQFAREGTGRWTDWAPNGGMIAFDAARGGPDRRIYFLGTDDNQQYSIEIPGEQASWAPDSNQLVYRSGRDGKQGIWISNRDDSGAHPVTSDGSDSFPSWSPDGRKIAFHREVGGNVDIYVMNVDGSNVQRLTDAAGPDSLPTWTPDGRIVFRSARTGGWGIYIMSASGGGQTQIITNADPGPDWSFGHMDVY